MNVASLGWKLSDPLCELHQMNSSHVVQGENLLYISGDFVALSCNSNHIRQ